ncbi:hypothetical protein [Limnobacter sp. UBA3528]|nr:hypothetical protein [Limnobacter sp. UBA3528]MAZ09512.1 hypothetical protein [Sutterellaceae bacterium]|tara:strand:+ start:6888 stop:8222 length:1335 start_codon:yes stop_codon:yes gene_type:complete
MAAPQALIKDLEGEVNVSRNGEIVAVKAGDYLMPGDEVVTGANGRLALEFPGSDGQIPAAGVMTANGKLTLGEQTGSNGQQQIVVLEDGECFEFTTELAENSAAAEGGAVAGLFGAGLLGAGSGGLAGAGAVAAGAFLAGGSGDSGSSDTGTGTNTGTSNAGGGGLGSIGAGEFSSQDSPQSLEEFATENLTQDNLQQSILQPIQDAVQNSQNNPESTPDNIATAVEQTGLGVLENVHDALVATTGEGTPQADLVQQLVDGVNQTPLGEPLSPITTPLAEAVNTDLGLDTLISALPNVDPTDGGLVTSVVDLADGITQPISEQVEPYDQLLQGLRDVAVEIDNVLESTLSQMSTEVPNLNSLGGDTPALPAEVEGGLADLVDGILGGADTLQSALEGAGSGSGLPEIPEGDLLGTLSSGISSGADALGGELGGLPGLPTDGLPG